MENKDNIYNRFKDAARTTEAKGFDRMEAVWNRVEEKLDNKKQRRIAAWWKYAGIAAMLILFITIGFVFTNNNQPALPGAEPNNSVTVIDTQKIIETFRPAREKEQVVVHEDTQKIKENVNDKQKALKKTTNTQKINKDEFVEGVITAKSDGLPLPGVDVTVRGTQHKTLTDFDGNFKIKASAKDTIDVTYPGMESISYAVNDKNNKNIALNGDVQLLDEAIVTSYRTTGNVLSNSSAADLRKALRGRVAGVKVDNEAHDYNYYRGNIRTATSSYTAVSVTSKTIEGKSNANFAESLQSQVPGLNVTTGSGQPGSSSTVVLRGMSSTNGQQEPLYIVDGYPLTGNQFRKLTPETIRNIEVLKDASATAIYGSRGANGVIVVQTNRSKREIRREQKKFRKELKKAEEENHSKPFAPAIPAKIAVDTTNTESYGSFEENKFENPVVNPLSTFSIDVDNASYTNIRRFINNGQTVPKDAVRVEEMINFFNYQYPQPENNHPFSISTEYSDAPWNPEHKLLKVGLQGKIIPNNELPASNFVFLVDVSGSMGESNKLPLLKESMKLLVKQMRKQDRIAIVVYAGAAGLVLPSTSGAEKDVIMRALDKLDAGGSTAGGAGIELAYKTAADHFIKGGNNRVILATDGDFNVGASSDSDMQTLIEQKRQSGVFLTCLGYGMGNYKDSKMEILADKGNGNYAYIDTMQEADRYLNKEFKGSMYAIAKDVKIQIEFNPKHVQNYRLIGYENRKLRDEDFANDAIDAGELGSGHKVTALYEIIPTGVTSKYVTNEPELKYSQPVQTANNYSNELATIKFMYKKPDGDKSTEIVKTIPNIFVPLTAASADFKFAAAVAWFGLKLRDSEFISDKSTQAILKLAREGLKNDTEGYRAEFIRLAERIE